MRYVCLVWPPEGGDQIWIFFGWRPYVIPCAMASYIFRRCWGMSIFLTSPETARFLPTCNGIWQKVTKNILGWTHKRFLWHWCWLQINLRHQTLFAAWIIFIGLKTITVVLTHNLYYIQHSILIEHVIIQLSLTDIIVPMGVSTESTAIFSIRIFYNSFFSPHFVPAASNFNPTW